ncbi:hypothetical protein CV102_21000 [Natronococcus pandeyae]|uniref:Uncharacterized protein n=1 Tax=Natronococcus pandeyae TaxID=2055836 RepID=A0A8J8PYF5_9EURY|nr:hypothetical protein CV102_21000 [Natronococcus pandeyae]
MRDRFLTVASVDSGEVDERVGRTSKTLRQETVFAKRSSYVLRRVAFRRNATVAARSSVRE